MLGGRCHQFKSLLHAFSPHTIGIKPPLMSSQLKYAIVLTEAQLSLQVDSPFVSTLQAIKVAIFVSQCARPSASVEDVLITVRFSSVITMWLIQFASLCKLITLALSSMI